MPAPASPRRVTRPRVARRRTLPSGAEVLAGLVVSGLCRPTRKAAIGLGDQCVFAVARRAGEELVEMARRRLGLRCWSRTPMVVGAHTPIASRPRSSGPRGGPAGSCVHRPCPGIAREVVLPRAERSAHKKPSSAPDRRRAAVDHRDLRRRPRHVPHAQHTLIEGAGHMMPPNPPRAAPPRPPHRDRALSAVDRTWVRTMTAGPTFRAGLPRSVPCPVANSSISPPQGERPATRMRGR